MAIQLYHQFTHSQLTTHVLVNRSPEQRPHSCDKFFGRERLGDVIVRAHLQP